MACRVQKIQVTKAGGDPLEREESRHQTADAGPQQNMAGDEVRDLKSGFRGRNPLLRLQEMYTGTLIQDLMATVEQAEQRAKQREEQRRRVQEQELEAFIAMQISLHIAMLEGNQVFVGAA